MQGCWAKVFERFWGIQLSKRLTCHDLLRDHDQMGKRDCLLRSVGATSLEKTIQQLAKQRYRSSLPPECRGNKREDCCDNDSRDEVGRNRISQPHGH